MERFRGRLVVVIGLLGRWGPGCSYTVGVLLEERLNNTSRHKTVDHGEGVGPIMGDIFQKSGGHNVKRRE